MSVAVDVCDYTGSCTKCKSVERYYRPRTGEQNLLVIHTDRTTICAGRRSDEKRKTLNKLEKITSAFRNSEGGHILVHIDGQKDQDRYLEHFDEFITRSFTDLIEDGQLYVEAYERRWLSELAGFQSIQDFLLITVKESAGIATVDFNTKVNNDNEKIRPTYITVAELLFNQPSTTNVSPVLRGLVHVQELHENRRTEIKAFKPKPEKLAEIQNNVSSFVDYIWNDLKLKENLTSMSKVHGGGSYFVGISERNLRSEEYKSKEPQIDGFELTNTSELVAGIEQKVKENVIVLLERTYSDVPEDLIKVQLHTLPNTNLQLYVLEVAIRFFNGLVFYDREGPRAYAIKDRKICRIEKEEWLKRFEDRFKECVNRK